MAKVYLNVVALMMNKPYRVHNVPFSYVPRHDVEIRDSLGNIVEPIHSPEPNERSTCRMTIVNMVDMTFNRVGYDFDSHEDMEEIFVHVTEYLKWVKQFNSPPDGHAVFASRAAVFLERVRKGCNRARRRKKLAGLEKPSFSDWLFGGGR